MVVIADQMKIMAKLLDRGKICMFLGYADGHAAGTYCIWNPETKKVIISCDVIFLRKSYGNWNQEQVSPRIIASMLEETDDNDLDIDCHIDRQLARQVSDSENESEIKK